MSVRVFLAIASALVLLVLAIVEAMAASQIQGGLLR